jgi:hypothetical protein
MWKLSTASEWKDVNSETEAFEGTNLLWAFDNLVTG